MNAKNRTGVYRRDYHRPNRKENKTMHRHSFGRNVPVGGVGDVDFWIPKMSERDLVIKAQADWRQRHSNAWRLSRQNTTTARKCFEFLRHRQTNYDVLRTRLYGAAFLALTRALCDAITEAYPFLRAECERYYQEKEGQKKYQTIKVLKRSVTSFQVADFNAKEEAKPDDPITEEEEIPAFFTALSSLDQERFLYLPPFLKPDQIRERRFGENANDRWWEWEEELGLESTRGRPDPSTGKVY